MLFTEYVMANFDKATGRDRYFELVDQAIKRLMDPSTGKVRQDLTEEIPCPLCGDMSCFGILFSKQGFDFVLAEEAVR